MPEIANIQREVVVGRPDLDGENVLAVAEFETEKYAKSNLCFCAMIFPPISIVSCCLPYICTLKYQRNLRCWLTDRSIKIESGFINKGESFAQTSLLHMPRDRPIAKRFNRLHHQL